MSSPKKTPLMTRRYVELIQQLLRNRFARSENDLFTAVFQKDPTRDSYTKARDRGTNPNLNTIETVARKVGIHLSYFVDRPDYIGELDYRHYLKRGGTSEGVPPVLAAFFESPAGRNLDSTTRTRMVQFDATFGPILDDVAAMAVMTAFKSVRMPPDAPIVPRPDDPTPTKRKRKVGGFEALAVPDVLTVHQPRAVYAKR